MTDDWPDSSQPPPFPIRPRRVVHTDGLELGQEVLLLPAGQDEPDGAARALSGVGTLYAREGDELVGLLHFQLLRAPWANGEGDVLALRVFGIKVERRRRGVASAMYAELRKAHPGYLIGADAELTDEGREMVRRFRARYPEVHVGRFDTAHRLHRTSGPDDPLYAPKLLELTKAGGGKSESAV